MPVLVVQGSEDMSSPPYLTGYPTAKLVPGACLIVYEGAPHGLPVSHPARLSAALDGVATATAAGRTDDNDVKFGEIGQVVSAG